MCIHTHTHSHAHTPRFIPLGSGLLFPLPEMPSLHVADCYLILEIQLKCHTLNPQAELMLSQHQGLPPCQPPTVKHTFLFGLQVFKDGAQVQVPCGCSGSHLMSGPRGRSEQGGGSVQQLCSEPPGGLFIVLPQVPIVRTRYISAGLVSLRLI